MPKAAAILTLQEWALQNGHSGTGYANTDPCRHTNRIWFQSLTLLLPMNAENHQTHKLIIEDSKGQEEYTLEEPIYSIGRDPSCDIRLSSFLFRATMLLWFDPPMRQAAIAIGLWMVI